MSEEITQPVVLDATVLSNFASSSTIDHLIEILDHSVDHLGDNIALLDIDYHEDDAASEIRQRLDEGEAEFFLGAIEYGGTLATDDLAARQLAVDYDVPVTGSVGILVLGVRAGVINVDTANEWLTG